MDAEFFGQLGSFVLLGIGVFCGVMIFIIYYHEREQNRGK